MRESMPDTATQRSPDKHETMVTPKRNSGATQNAFIAPASSPVQKTRGRDPIRNVLGRNQKRAGLGLKRANMKRKMRRLDSSVAMC